MLTKCELSLLLLKDEKKYVRISTYVKLKAVTETANGYTAYIERGTTG